MTNIAVNDEFMVFMWSEGNNFGLSELLFRAALMSLITGLNKKFYVLILISALLASCATNKDKFINRTYHQLVARDNGWFNANEIVKKVKQDMYDANPDNFDEVLPIFVYGSDKQAKAAYPELDEAIGKVDKVINEHSMRIKRKERNKRIDENYITKGQADFYKQQYLKAERSFAYVSRKFKGHDSQHLASMWLARTYGQLDQFAKAATVIDIIKDDEDKLPKKFPLAEFEAIQADLNVRKGEVDIAILHLERAVDLTKVKAERVRWAFILAQLYELKGKTQKAIDQYLAVTRMNPPYEIAFHAQIFQALALDRTSDKKGIRAKLERMLKDDKHVDHYDMIHYALADLDIKENDMASAIAHLETSCRVSTTDTKQKAKSYLKLADLYFDDRNYKGAQSYYDSTRTLMNEEHERYNEINNRANVLGDLVEQLDIITLEDSLQSMAAMDSTELRKLIRKRTREREREEEERLRAEEEAREVLTNNTAQNNNNNAAGKGGWYFYDQSQIGRGMAEFRQKWGDRTLDDDWRRKDKSGSAFAEETEEPESGEEGVEEEEAPWKSEDFYTKDLPLSDSALAASHARRCEALYKSGMIYKEQLEDMDNGLDQFVLLIDDYEECTYTPDSYYQKYRILLTKEQQEGYFSLGETSDDVKRAIMNLYPDSPFARLIENPDALAADSLQRMEESAAYKETFRSFKNRRYQQVIVESNVVITEEPDNHLIRKYYMLRAMSVGGMRDQVNFRRELEEIKTKFAGTDEAARAEEMLKALKNVDIGSVSESTASVVYKSPEGEQYFIMIFPKSKAALNTVKAKVSDFNKKFFRNDGLKVTATIYEKDMQMLQVNLFKDKAKAKVFMELFTDNKVDLKGVNDQGFKTYLITPDNFALFFMNKDMENYQSFYEANYK